MKKLLLFAIAMLTFSMAMAVPAHPGTACVIQPDGSSLTIRLCGDEYLHYYTTADGYSVVKHADGAYVYARLAEGQLCPTARVAHDEQERSAEEQAWLHQIGKYQTPQMSSEVAGQQQAEFSRRAEARNNAQSYNYDNFRGLIILVQYNDCAFSREDYAEVVNGMVNQENYSGYDNSPYGHFTGSVRDYFYDNSSGVFSPEFDVVGPVTINYSQYHANATQRVNDLTKAAIETVDPQVDFSLYDGDGDGTVDMMYFIFAGIGSHYSGNDSRLIWPHASFIFNMRKDGVNMGRYACSTELMGTPSWNIIDGIGVICHEFSHVLGLMDLYDTNYTTNGQSAHPGEWCIMANGSYQNNSRTPSGYSLYERYAIGFAYPQLIAEEGSYTLPPIGDSNIGYRLDTPVKREFFLMENRQKTSKWDKFLPGSGMLVFRVDSTNAQVWMNNTINANEKHNYFELLRAGGVTDGVSRASDPFPGSSQVHTLNYASSPTSLVTWAGKKLNLGFENITETGTNVTFDIVDLSVLKSISLPEQMTVGHGLTCQIRETRFPELAPYMLEWSSSDESVATIDALGVLTGNAVGEADIMVMANGNPQLTGSCHVKVADLPIAASVADFKRLNSDDEAALMLHDALVVFTVNGDAYLRDASGAIRLANLGLGLETGDKLNGSLFGKLSIKDRVPQLQRVEGLTYDNGYTVARNHSVFPRELNVSEVTADDYCDQITLKATPLVVNSGIWAVSDENRIRLFNTFKLSGISVPAKIEGKYFDVTGIYLTNVLKEEVINELGLTSELKEVEAPEANSITTRVACDTDEPLTVISADGRVVAQTTVGKLSQLRLLRGIYVLKTAQRTWRIAK